MKTNYFRTVFAAFFWCMLILAVSCGAVLAQGKGKDHGGGNGGGNVRGNGNGGGNRGGGDQNRGGGGQRQMGGVPPGQQRRMEVFRQPQVQPQQVQRGGGWERRQQPQQQIVRQPEQRQIFRQQMPRQVYTPQQTYQARGNERGNGNGRWRQEERNPNAAPLQRQFPWGGDRIPPGQIRSQEVHERNAIRQAGRQAEREYQGQYRNAQSYYQQPSYYSQPRTQYRGYGSYQSFANGPAYPYAVQQYYEPYAYRNGGVMTYSPLYIPNTYAYEPYSAYENYYPSYQYLPNYYSYADTNIGWKTMLLRTLASFVLGNSNASYYGAQPYDAYYGYDPNVFGYDNYSQYANYYPGYYPTDTYYSQPSYSYASYSEPLVSSIPVDELVRPSYCGYSSSLLREVLAQGYEQGYYAAQYSRRDRYRRRYLRNLYTQDDNYYDPYSYTIGENRRVFAEGYALGYQDAIDGNGRYASGYARNTDLFSLLVSNVVGLG